MQLDPDVCYRALRTRDARFDGRFFTAVRSTGVAGPGEPGGGGPGDAGS